MTPLKRQDFEDSLPPGAVAGLLCDEPPTRVIAQGVDCACAIVERNTGIVDIAPRSMANQARTSDAQQIVGSLGHPDGAATYPFRAERRGKDGTKPQCWRRFGHGCKRQTSDVFDKTLRRYLPLDRSTSARSTGPRPSNRRVLRA